MHIVNIIERSTQQAKNLTLDEISKNLYIRYIRGCQNQKKLFVILFIL